MNVFHSVYNYWEFSGATEQARKISRVFADDKTIFFLNSSKKNAYFLSRVSVDERFTVIDLPRNSIFKIAFVFYYFIKFKPYILHTHGFHRLIIFVAFFFRKLKVLLKCTLLGTDDLHSLYSRRFSFLNKLLVSRVDKVNCLNSVIYDINKNFVDDEKLCVIPNGVEQQNHTSSKRENIVLIVGAVVPRKNVLEAIKYYKETFNPNVYQLLIVGPLDNQIAEFEAEYLRKCYLSAKEVEGNVKFTGKLDHEATIALFKKSKAMIFFSKREGTPNVVLEALSCNCPVIFKSSDIVVRDVLGPTLNVELESENFHEQMVKADFLDSVIQSDALTERAKSFSIETISGKHEMLYAEI